jgi:dihydrofolate reductase
MASTADQEDTMSKVIADMSMSLDGFIAREDDGIDQLIGWMFAGGDVAVPTATPGLDFHVDAPSAELLEEAKSGIGALVGGRRYFDLAGGWGGRHPMGVPVYVVTHRAPDGWDAPDSTIHFVTEGVESAIAQAKKAAGGKDVGIASPSIVQQCLDAGLLDAINVNVVPIVLGSGRPFFSGIASAPVALTTPRVVAANGVTHLRYEVVKDATPAAAPAERQELANHG